MMVCGGVGGMLVSDGRNLWTKGKLVDKRENMLVCGWEEVVVGSADG